MDLPPELRNQIYYLCKHTSPALPCLSDGGELPKGPPGIQLGTFALRRHHQSDCEDAVSSHGSPLMHLFAGESLVPTSFAPPMPEYSAPVFIAGREVRDGCLYVDCCCKPCYYTRLNQPAITRTSRTIRTETIPIYYGANGFYLNTTGATIWLKRAEAHVRFITDAVKVGQNLVGHFKTLNWMLDMGLSVVEAQSGKVLSRVEHIKSKACSSSTAVETQSGV